MRRNIPKTRARGLAIARAVLPPEVCPPGYRRYKYDRLGDSQLLKPVGGIAWDGNTRLFGVDVRPSPNMPPPMSVLKSRSSRKQHVIPTRDLPPNAGTITPTCGNPIKKWRRIPIGEEGLHICTKAAYTSGGTWCRNCVDSLREIIKDAGPEDGRATHLSLMPMSEEAAALLPLAERDNATYLLATVNAREYGSPEYEYCNECRQDWHLCRDDATRTDWNR